MFSTATKIRSGAAALVAIGALSLAGVASGALIRSPGGLTATTPTATTTLATQRSRDPDANPGPADHNRRGAPGRRNR
jgi:hypothetical protein